MISDFFSAYEKEKYIENSSAGWILYGKQELPVSAGNKEEYTADPFDRLSDDVSAYGGIQGKAD